MQLIGIRDPTQSHKKHIDKTASTEVFSQATVRHVQLQLHLPIIQHILLVELRQRTDQVAQREHILRPQRYSSAPHNTESWRSGP